MIFTVNRASFSEAVLKMMKVVGTKTSMPVLEGILISAEKGRITLAAYNLEMGMKRELPASCEEEGDIVITAHYLSEILRRMKGENVRIKAEENLSCRLESDEAVFELMGMAAVDFPEMPSVTEGTTLSVDGSMLSDMVRGCIFAVSQSEGSKPVLTGINVSVKDGFLQMVAIDGFRLAIRRQKTDIEKTADFIISGKAINEVSRLIDDETDSVSITVGQRLISFKIDEYIFISRTIEGEFVNFEKIIPTDYSQKIKTDVKELTDAVERVSLLVSEAFSTPLRCVFSEEKIVLSCNTTKGRSNENYFTELEGNPFEIGLNSRYFLDALKACDIEEIQMRFNGSASGVVIRPDDDQNNSFLYLIMPMRMR